MKLDQDTITEIYVCCAIITTIFAFLTFVAAYSIYVAVESQTEWLKEDYEEKNIGQ